MEFWAVIYHAWSHSKTGKRRRWFLVALLFICIVLGISDGPSTANLMRPRLDDWPAGGTTYWINATSNELYPLEMTVTPKLEGCLQNADDAACPYGDYDLLDTGFHILLAIPGANG